MTDQPTGSRPARDQRDRLSRRRLLQSTAAGVVAAAVGGASTRLRADEPKPTSETLVATLYQSLSEAQRKAVCLDFDNPLRHQVDNNWYISDARVAKGFTADQQKLIEDIFLGLHSPEYAAQVLKQVESDSGRGNKGLGDCAVAIFGQPGTGKFEFVLSGRHVTRRCDGDSVAGAAFGGPIFYGHAAGAFVEKPDHPGNLYWFQARRANELYQALDGRQRAVALLGDAREESGTDTVKLAGSKAKLAGLPVGDLSRDQQELMRKVLADLLAPFRKVDVDESMKLIEADAGFAKLHLSYFKNHDIGNDGVWDVWQVEGPGMLWYFRGKPHVHTWVHIRKPE